MGGSLLAVYNDALQMLGEAPLVSLTDDVPARYDLDRAYDGAVQFMLRQAAWRFALSSATITAVVGAPTSPGYAAHFPVPNDSIYIHSVFALDGSREVPIDVREERRTLFANVPSLTIRYVSSTYSESANWPDAFAMAFSGYLASQVAYRVTGSLTTRGEVEQEFGNLLQLAKNADALPRDPWLRFQFNGMFIRSVRYVLEHGMWRFATKTVPLTAATTPDPIIGASARFDKPADWLRTISVSRSPTGFEDWVIPFHEEDDALFTDYFIGADNAVTLRYVSTDGFDATLWSEAFSDAVLMHLSMTEKDVSAADIMAFKDSLRTAENRDASRDSTRINQTSRIVRARWGGSQLAREQGWYRY